MVVLGAGGHANEVLDLLSNKFSPENLYLFDNTGGETSISSKRFNRIIRSGEELQHHFSGSPDFCVAVGRPYLRKLLAELALSLGGRAVNAIATTAVVRPDAQIGTGLNVMHLAYISPGARISNGVLINAGALIHHDAVVGEYAEISPGAVLLGGSTVSAFCRVGARATILPGITVGDGAIVGAGAVVIKDVSPRQTVMGIPAQPRISK